MAKKNSAPAGNESALEQQDPASSGDAQVGAAVDEKKDDEESEQNPSEPEPLKPAATVLALVLSDCVYGKCGEVKEFPVDQAEAIAAAGYIDTHPNAVKSAKQ